MGMQLGLRAHVPNAISATNSGNRSLCPQRTAAPSTEWNADAADVIMALNRNLQMQRADEPAYDSPLPAILLVARISRHPLGTRGTA
jgi:hypothetical protein